jgi:hypothetical protein
MIDLAPHISRFGRVSLEDLNVRAPLLDRQENKYLLTASQLAELSLDLADRADVLEIDGRTVFTYETTYFDTPDLLTFRQHAQGKRRRMKVRSRRYVDSGECWLEVKLKGSRGRTVKQRLAIDTRRHGQVDGEVIEFIDRCVRQEYGERFAEPLGPALTMRYRRITLVGADRPERVTIDHAASFRAATGEQVDAPHDLVIVEVKSPDGHGVADQALHARGVRSTSCSKYCVGVAMLGLDERYNRFKPVLSRHFDWQPPSGRRLPAPHSTEPSPAEPSYQRVIDLLVAEYGQSRLSEIVDVVRHEAARIAVDDAPPFAAVRLHRAARRRLAGEISPRCPAR